MAIFSLKNLYTNTVLDGSVILCVCSFAIETNFPLSNLQTKHIFGILRVLRKYEDHSGHRRRPICFSLLAETPPFAAVSQIGAEGAPNVAANAAVSRVYRYTQKRH